MKSLTKHLMGQSDSWQQPAHIDAIELLRQSSFSYPCLANGTDLEDDTSLSLRLCLLIEYDRSR